MSVSYCRNNINAYPLTIQFNSVRLDNPVAVCVAVDVKKPLTEDSVGELEQMKKRSGLSIMFFHLMRHPSLDSQLQNRPQNRASLLHQFVQFFKSLGLMLLPQQTTADEVTLSITDSSPVCCPGEH